MPGSNWELGVGDTGGRLIKVGARIWSKHIHYYYHRPRIHFAQIHSLMFNAYIIITCQPIKLWVNKPLFTFDTQTRRRRVLINTHSEVLLLKGCFRVFLLLLEFLVESSSILSILWSDVTHIIVLYDIKEVWANPNLLFRRWLPRSLRYLLFDLR